MRVLNNVGCDDGRVTVSKVAKSKICLHEQHKKKMSLAGIEPAAPRYCEIHNVAI